MPELPEVETTLRAIKKFQGQNLTNIKVHNRHLRWTVAKDLEKLITVLDWAHESGIKIVITNLSLPGLRWIQHNDKVRDDRMWQDLRYHELAKEFWIYLVIQIVVLSLQQMDPW